VRAQDRFSPRQVCQLIEKTIIVLCSVLVFCDKLFEWRSYLHDDLAHFIRGVAARLARDSPDDSRTGVNIRAFPALQQDW
jgi:hypothetical protein